MNLTDNQTQGCDPLGLYGPEESEWLLKLAVVQCYCVMALGILGNVLVLWCVATCTRTRRPVKLLLFNVFVPVLVICVVAMPVFAEYLLAFIECDPHRISRNIMHIVLTMYHTLARTELAAIAVVAVVRAMSVWAPRRQPLGLCGGVLLVAGICLYTGSFIITVAATAILNGTIAHLSTVITVVNFLTVTLPVIVTSASYISMLIIIRRNSRRAAGRQQQSAQQGRGLTTRMDSATRAMLAVFVSTLVFSLPLSIFRLTGTGSHQLRMHAIFQSLYSVQFIVDPLAMVWFNKSFRNRVIYQMKKVTQPCLHHSPPTPAPSSSTTQQY